MKWVGVRDGIMGYPPAVPPDPAFGDGTLEIDKEQFLQRVAAIRKQKMCSYDAAIRIALGEDSETAVKAGQSGTIDLETLKDEIKKEILGIKVSPKNAADMSMVYEQMKEQEKKIQQQIKDEEEKKQQEIEKKARELVESKFITKHDEDNNDGLPKDPLSRAAYDAAVKSIQDTLAGKNVKSGFELNETTLGAIGEIVTNITQQVTTTVDKAQQRGRSKDFILNMGHIIQVCKAAGFNNIQLSDIIRIMELAEGVVTHSPTTKNISKKEVLDELANDMEESFNAPPPPSPPKAKSKSFGLTDENDESDQKEAQSDPP